MDMSKLKMLHREGRNKKRRATIASIWRTAHFQPDATNYKVGTTPRAQVLFIATTSRGSSYKDFNQTIAFAKYYWDISDSI